MVRSRKEGSIGRRVGSRARRGIRREEGRIARERGIRREEEGYIGRVKRGGTIERGGSDRVQRGIRRTKKKGIDPIKQRKRKIGREKGRIKSTKFMKKKVLPLGKQGIERGNEKRGVDSKGGPGRKKGSVQGKRAGGKRNRFRWFYDGGSLETRESSFFHTKSDLSRFFFDAAMREVLIGQREFFLITPYTAQPLDGSGRRLE